MKIKPVFIASAITLVIIGLLVTLSMKSKPDTSIIEEPTEVNEDSFYSDLLNPTTIELSRKELMKIRKAYMEMSLDIPKIEISFHETYSPLFKTNNILIYQITQKFFNQYDYGNPHADPLILMAIANVEYGGITTPSVLLAPAVPTSYGILPKKESILSFDYYSMLHYMKALDKDRDYYRGIFQMFVTANTRYASRPELLMGSEYIKLLVAKADGVNVTNEIENLPTVEGSGYYSIIEGMHVYNSKGIYGDRFNYSDTVNRVGGTILHRWKTTEVVPINMYNFITLTALAHNSTPSVLTFKDNNTLTEKWWPFKTIGHARFYAEDLAKEESIEYIKTLAYDNVKSSRISGLLKFRLTTDQAIEVVNKLVIDKIVQTGYYKISNAGQMEKVAYPVQVLYNYFVLEAIYSGN